VDRSIATPVRLAVRHEDQAAARDLFAVLKMADIGRPPDDLLPGVEAEHVSVAVTAEAGASEEALDRLQ
jgi:hypothetical protein